jgi:hypothetical protein
MLQPPAGTKLTSMSLASSPLFTETSIASWIFSSGVAGCSVFLRLKTVAENGLAFVGHRRSWMITVDLGEFTVSITATRGG